MTTNPTNVVWHHATVTRERREAQNGHKSCVLWFTGLSGAGKSTLAHAMEEQLHELGCRTFVLDGDNVRHGLSSNLGFSEDDRRENIRRIGEAAKLMMEAGVIAMTAFITRSAPTAKPCAISCPTVTSSRCIAKLRWRRAKRVM
jgi:adenylylsulfate kinase